MTDLTKYGVNLKDLEEWKEFVGEQEELGLEELPEIEEIEKGEGLKDFLEKDFLENSKRN